MFSVSSFSDSFLSVVGFFFSTLFLFTPLELIYSISVLLMHADCIRFKVSWYPYLFSGNAVQ